MSLKQIYYGQQDSTDHATPDVVLTGDPGTDQPVLAAAGYLGGRVMAIKTSATTGRGPVVVPCDAATMLPFGFLLNGPGEFAGAIGPSGSKRAPILRALAQFTVDSQAYDTVNTPTFAVGAAVYCGGTNKSNVGLITDATNKGTSSAAIGICTHIPTASEPWLGVASLI